MQDINIEECELTAQTDDGVWVPLILNAADLPKVERISGKGALALLTWKDDIEEPSLSNAFIFVNNRASRILQKINEFMNRQRFLQCLNLTRTQEEGLKQALKETWRVPVNQLRDMVEGARNAIVQMHFEKYEDGFISLTYYWQDGRVHVRNVQEYDTVMPEKGLFELVDTLTEDRCGEEEIKETDA